MKILTQNIWTPFIGSNNDILRIDEFVENVSDYDVLMIQEAFIFTMFFMRFWGRDIYLEEKLRENGFNHFLKGSKSMFFQNNGLLVASKYPLELISEIKFKDNEDDEMFTKKGALIFRVKDSSFKRDPVFVNTHLHCGSGYTLYRDIRKKQLKDIKNELLKHDIKSDVLLAGDLNINALEEDNDTTEEREYNSIINSFENIYDPLRHSKDITSPPDARLDYIILIKNDHFWLENGKVIKITGKNKSFPEGISDHYGVETELVGCFEIK
jgi:endonuclease/exonuclease/phosphatase family metal-dependent hydrolase